MLKLFRKWQTMILAILTFVVFVWAAIDVFDVEPSVIWAFFMSAVTGLFAIIVFAALTIACLNLLKRRKQ
ncbi:Uncharacterised protein [BD1-7 clade bacterium]|uniref:Uncharacterized protein n=1 Tax=BD1-7 clade bacterium TaxID=2029982 RepID=A0A5S9QHN4_9GAMM|nr:Uncharacterised protein [BD1-7 clade bacterium]CAA0117545.1 Uncharacterised protein [BD1-7 clade bacterium]